MVVFWLLSCASTGNIGEDSTFSLMDETSFLRRLSLDIRGILPSVEEYDRLTDKGAIEQVDAFLQDEYFGTRVRGMFADYYQTEVDSYLVTGADFGVVSEAGFREAVGQEPLRVIQEIATNDLPWTNLVTADWTMANEVSSLLFPVDYEGEGWQKAHYTDGRPAAGILASNGMWWRYTSTLSNANRNRANTISRLLLCTNYLHRPIQFDRGLDLLDEEAVQDAISQNPSCVGCHQTLDPLAAHLFGFLAIQSDSPLEVQLYHPDRERSYQQFLGVSPAYYGQSSYGLQQLGEHIAGDDRFLSCVIEQVSEQLLGREYQIQDIGWSTPHRNQFLQDGLVLRSLIRSIVSDPVYRPGWYESDTTGSNAKLLKPSQIISVVEALTGFVWEYQDDGMFDNDIVGLKSLSGGGHVFVEPSATYILSVSRLMEQAAMYVVMQEHEQEPSQRKFFVEVSVDEGLEEKREESIAMLQRWHLLLFGRNIEPEGEEIAANIDLWNALYSIHNDSFEAWVGVLTTLLQDPDFVLY